MNREGWRGTKVVEEQTYQILGGVTKGHFTKLDFQGFQLDYIAIARISWGVICWLERTLRLFMLFHFQGLQFQPVPTGVLSIIMWMAIKTTQDLGHGMHFFAVKLGLGSEIEIQ